MAKQTDVDAWMKSGEYLPKVLRDFHDQKAIFKAMHEIIQESPETTIKRPSWVEGHCYVIDVFLWFMARRGYTLQKTKRRGNFRDLMLDVEFAEKSRNEKLSALLLRSMK